jgi:hypothetical protein
MLSSPPIFRGLVEDMSRDLAVSLSFCSFEVFLGNSLLVAVILKS